MFNFPALFLSPKKCGEIRIESQLFNFPALFLSPKNAGNSKKFVGKWGKFKIPYGIFVWIKLNFILLNVPFDFHLF